MRDRIIIPHRIYEQMLQHAQAVHPLEACGLLAGREARVTRLFEVANVLASPTAYEMEPREQVQAMLTIEKEGWELVGIYHSHPAGPQTPSASDVDQAFYPQAAQVIVSLADPQKPVARAFSIVAGQVDEIMMFIV